MPFQRVPSTVRVSILQQLYGELVVNTLSFTSSTPYAVTEMQTLAAEIIQWWDGSLSQHLSDNLSLTEVNVLDLASDNGPSVTVAPAVGTKGKRISTSLPGNAAFSVQFQTGFRGRSYRGRNFVSGLPEVAVSGNALLTADADSIRAAYESLLTSNAPTQFDWVVVSRVQGGVELPEGISTPVIGVTYHDQAIDSQRRRLNNRGA